MACSLLFYRSLKAFTWSWVVFAVSVQSLQSNPSPPFLYTSFSAIEDWLVTWAKIGLQSLHSLCQMHTTGLWSLIGGPICLHKSSFNYTIELPGPSDGVKIASNRILQFRLRCLSNVLKDFYGLATFKRTFFEDIDLLEKHLIKEMLHEIDCKTTLTKLRTTLAKIFSSELIKSSNLTFMKYTGLEAQLSKIR
ncbi:hypothetical protein Tco_0871804 [Tanacetum coccineum]